MPVIPATTIQEAKIGGSQLQASPGKVISPLSEKQTKSKKDWGYGSRDRVLA
jgi:hypothetical protein